MVADSCFAVETGRSGAGSARKGSGIRLIGPTSLSVLRVEHAIIGDSLVVECANQSPVPNVAPAIRAELRLPVTAARCDSPQLGLTTTMCSDLLATKFARRAKLSDVWRV